MDKYFVPALLIGLMAAGSAAAQQPVQPVDLRIVGVDCTVASPTTTRYDVQCTFDNVRTSPASYVTALGFFRHGSRIASVVLNLDASTSICNADPTCSVACDVVVNGGHVSVVHCAQWPTWMPGPGGVTCDPTNPDVTCLPITVCACHAPFTVTATLTTDTLEPTVAYLDPDNSVSEADETNNLHMACMIVPAFPQSWGGVKAIYR